MPHTPKALAATALLLATWMSGSAPATAQEKEADQRACVNYEMPFDERLVRNCDAKYGLCANPPPAWQRNPRLMQVCEAVRREKSASAAASPGAAGGGMVALARPVAPAMAVMAQAGAASFAGLWRLNANGFPGDINVQQAADGTLAGVVYSEPLTGYFAPGERMAVWLRGQPAQPMQVYIAQVSPDGSAMAGRFYGLNASNSGATPARNVFAFSAQRAAPPGHPGEPAAAAGPASVSGALPVVANGHAGTLQLAQAPDGSLKGSLYGDRIEGHYAAGTGSIAFLRFTGAQPVQVYVGTATAQGLRGEFYALTGGAGATPQRMRYEWSAQAPQMAAAPSAAMPSAPMMPPVAAGALPSPRGPALMGGAGAPNAAVMPMPAAAMPAMPAPATTANSPEETVLAPFPRGFEIAPGSRRFDSFAVGRAGPLRVMVQSPQPLVVTLRRPDGRALERQGAGDIVIDDAATDADLRAGLIWSVMIRPAQDGQPARGQLMVQYPPADANAVRQSISQAQQQSAAPVPAPRAGQADVAAEAARQQRAADQTALARHDAMLQQLRPQLPPDTAAVMSQSMALRAQGQTVGQAQQAMMSDARMAAMTQGGAMAQRFQRTQPAGGGAAGGGAAASGSGAGSAAGASMSGTQPASPSVAGAVNRLLPPGGAATQGGAPAQGAAGSAPNPAARPVITSLSVVEGDPGTPVMINGLNLGEQRGEVRFVVANGSVVPAPITLWTNSQIVLQVPSVEGVGPFNGQVYVRRPDGSQSDLRPFSFRPTIEVRTLHPLFNGDATVHPFALAAVDFHGFGSKLIRREAPVWGGNGRDEFFKGRQLKNGWTVERCFATPGAQTVWGPGSPVSSGTGAVNVSCSAGGTMLDTTADWWLGWGSRLLYSVGVVVRGPKGLSPL